jgi:hypothetical protein
MLYSFALNAKANGSFVLDLQPSSLTLKLLGKYSLFVNSEYLQ